MAFLHVCAEFRTCLLDLKNVLDSGIILRFLNGHVIQIRHLILIRHRRTERAENRFEQHHHQGDGRHSDRTDKNPPLAVSAAAGFFRLLLLPAGITPLRLVNRLSRHMTSHSSDGPGGFITLIRPEIREVKFHFHIWIFPKSLQICDHGVCGLIAMLQIRRHGLHTDQFQLFRDVGIDLPRRQRNGAEMLDGHGHGGLALKGQPPRQHFIEYHAGGIDVAAGVRPVAPRLLRRNVVDRPQSLLRQRLGRIRKTRNAKISHLHAAVPQNHDILGLDVPVDDAAAVGVAEPPHDLGDKVQGLPPVQLTPLFHILLQGDTVDQLHDDILCVAAAGHIVNGYDVGVGQLRDRLRFGVEPAAELLVLSQIALEDFNGHQTVEAMALSLIDHRHAACADALQNLIAVVQHFPDVLIHSSPPSLTASASGRPSRCPARPETLQFPSVGAGSCPRPAHAGLQTAFPDP